MTNKIYTPSSKSFGTHVSFSHLQHFLNHGKRLSFVQYFSLGIPSTLTAPLQPLSNPGFGGLASSAHPCGTLNERNVYNKSHSVISYKEFFRNIIFKKHNKFTPVFRDTLTVLPFTAISIPREMTFVPCVHAILLGWASITVNGPLAPIIITIVCCGWQNSTFVGYIWRKVIMNTFRNI